MAGTRILLVDNGSYEPAATLALRDLAAVINAGRKEQVRPVSVMHSDKVDPALLRGQPAVIFEQAVRQAKDDGIDELVVLPLFIGPSRAVTEFIPKVFKENAGDGMRLKVLPTLFDEDGSDLAHILEENLKATGWKKGSGTVLLCDHGSPIKEVTACRDRLATALRKELRLKPDELVACSMERREGPEYDFNEPLLEDALQEAKGDAVILMLFLLAGRHAGPNGDVATIAKEHAPAGLRWKLSPLLGTHPSLPSLVMMRHDRPPVNLKAAKNIVIGAIILSLLWPVAITLCLPKGTLDLAERLLLWLGGVALILSFVYAYFRAMHRKKS